MEWNRQVKKRQMPGGGFEAKWIGAVTAAGGADRRARQIGGAKICERRR